MQPIFIHIVNVPAHLATLTKVQDFQNQAENFLTKVALLNDNVVTLSPPGELEIKARGNSYFLLLVNLN